MRPENLKSLFLLLLEQNDYSIYTSLLPGDSTVILHKQGFQPLKCFPFLASLTTRGPRAVLDKNNTAWQMCDMVLFFEALSRSIWLVPVLTIPDGCSIILGPSYDEYRLVVKTIEPVDLANVLDVAKSFSENAKE